MPEPKISIIPSSGYEVLGFPCFKGGEMLWQEVYGFVIAMNGLLLHQLHIQRQVSRYDCDPFPENGWFPGLSLCSGVQCHSGRCFQEPCEIITTLLRKQTLGKQQLPSSSPWHQPGWDKTVSGLFSLHNWLQSVLQRYLGLLCHCLVWELGQ